MGAKAQLRVISGGRREVGRGEVPLEFLIRRRGEVAAAPHPLEKLAVIHDDGRQPGFRDAMLRAEVLRVGKQLFFQGHLRSIAMRRLMQYAGDAPQMSRPDFPHAEKTDTRDNARMDRNGFIARLELCLTRSGLSPRAASLKATGKADTIRDILRGKVLEPSWSRIERLAAVFEVDPHWLASGAGNAPGTDAGQRARIINRIDRADPERYPAIEAMLDILLADTSDEKAG